MVKTSSDSICTDHLRQIKKTTSGISRKSSRYHKSVNCNGDIVQHQTGFNGKKMRKLKRKRQSAKGRNEQPLKGVCAQNKSHQPGQANEHLLALLKQRGIPLPVVRCVNRVTGEHQIGIPNNKKYLKNASGLLSHMTATKPTGISLINTISHQTFQEQVILENLVSLVPFDPNLLSLNSIEEFRSKMMHDIESNTMLCNVKKENIGALNDSTYHWL